MLIFLYNEECPTVASQEDSRGSQNMSYKFHQPATEATAEFPAKNTHKGTHYIID